jgi:hypothetical protein
VIVDEHGEKGELLERRRRDRALGREQSHVVRDFATTKKVEQRRPQTGIHVQNFNRGLKNGVRDWNRRLDERGYGRANQTS